MFIDTGYLFVHFLSEKKEAFLSQLANTESLLQVACAVYHELLAKKQTEDIRNLPVDEKMELFNEAKRISKSHTVGHIIKVVKSLQALGTLVQIDDPEAKERVAKFLNRATQQ